MKLLSSKEVAELLHIKEITVRVNAEKGRLGFRAIKVGKLWKFPEEDVITYLYGKKGGENENGRNN